MTTFITLNRLMPIFLAGISYFSLHSQTVTDVDGNVYHTVNIGNQVWLQENMRVLHNPDGTDILNVWSYQDDTALASVYGYLYDWNSAMNGSTGVGAQGICPDGWHIPSDEEWTELGNFLGGNPVAGGKLKEAGSEHWSAPNTGATNASGFTALPSGEKDGDVYQYLHLYAVIWSSTQTSETKAKYRYLAYDDQELHPYNYYKYFGYSVRCIQNFTTGINEEQEEDSREIFFIPHDVDLSFDGPGGICIADLDGDGLKDIIAAGIDANLIAWWKNLGGSPASWSYNDIGNNFQGAIYVSTGDIDGDQDIDVLGAAYNGHRLAWFENSENGQNWTRHDIVSGFTQAHEIMAYDFEPDGDLDVFGVSAGLNKISCFENDGNLPPSWTEQIITNDFSGARSVDAGDFDGDGDTDIAGAALNDNEIAWWRNDGGSPVVWTKFVIKSGFLYSHKVQIIDIDQDQDPDILGTAYTSGLRWFENQGGSPLQWTERYISGFNSAVIGLSFDINMDGLMDIAASAQGTGNVAIWLNEGGTPFNWAISLVDNLGGAWPLHYGDMDNDGDTDMVCGGNSANTIRWYENVLITGLPDEFTGNSMKISLKSYPNPSYDMIRIDYQVEEAGEILLRLTDTNGKTVKFFANEIVTEGKHSISCNSDDISPGTYILQLILINSASADLVAASKIIIQ